MVVEYTFPKDDSLKTGGELRDSSNGWGIRLNLESFRRMSVYGVQFVDNRKWRDE